MFSTQAEQGTTPPDKSALLPQRALTTPFAASFRGDTPGAVPPGEDGLMRADLENEAARTAQEAGIASDAFDERDLLSMVRAAEAQAQLYTAQVNRRAWAQSYRAWHSEHTIGSKYTRPEWRNRSRLFIPKTRGAVRKDMAAASASLFNNMDAISCRAGNEADPRQRAAAAIMQELINYRTDRASGKASFPWFLIAMGARQDAVIAGICISKQYWKHEYRLIETKARQELNQETSEWETIHKKRYELVIDRPDILLVPPENVIIDPAAPWTEPAQKSAYIILKYPMTVDEIMEKMESPVNPWLHIDEATLRSSVNNTKQDQEAIRRAREMGLDRFDETQTGGEHQIIWVYESFLRSGSEDYNFWSLGSTHYLTRPEPTRETYPEQFGERPLSYGFGALESHRIFPMSPVESWQPLQTEVNDLRNLTLDATKQNVMPISKVRRGRRIDMDQVKRRSAGSSIFVDEPDDVTWETPPAMPQQVFEVSQKLDIEMDDIAGQQNYGNVEQSNALGKTLGGLRLAAGAANAVQEFDLRVWLETWAQPALAQVVRLEQYYESDPVILGLCGERAQLFEKHGVDRITDELLEQSIAVQVDVGLGAGDPQQRLFKFQSAAQVLAPLLSQSAEFQSGQVELNWEELAQEIFGAVGYRDGGMRFFKINPGPKQNALQDLKTQELMAKIAKDNRTGQASYFQGLAALAKVALGKRELEAEIVDRLLGRQVEARDLAHQHADMRHNSHLAALDHGHRHGMAILEHRRNLANDAAEAAQQAGEGAELEGASPPVQGPPTGGAPPMPSAAGPPGSPSAPSPPGTPGDIQFVRDPRTNRIVGAKFVPSGPAPQPAAPAASPAPGRKASDTLARLHELTDRLSRGRRVVRDQHGNITGVE